MKPFKIFIAFLCLFGVLFFVFLINKPHRDISNEPTVFQLDSHALLSNFMEDEAEASIQYLDQTIEVYGRVTEINMNFLTLDDKIYCKFDDNTPKISLNTNLKVKGRCIGFDELLELIKLDQCTLTKHL